MKQLKIKDNKIMQIGIQQEILRSDEARYDHRLHGVLLVSKGFNCFEVGQMFGQYPTTIHRWVNRFNEKGFAGLYEGERTGRPQNLDALQWKRLGRDLRKHPREYDYDQNLWDGKLLSYHLENKYGIKLGVRQCQRIFKKMGFRRRKPRPVITNANPEAQKAFKKTLHVSKKNKY